jgi:hypothetical protein
MNGRKPTEIRPGSIVRMRCAGSPEMVVAYATEPAPPDPVGVGNYFTPQVPFRPAWICYWSNQRALKTGSFPAETLELVEAKVGAGPGEEPNCAK